MVIKREWSLELSAEDVLRGQGMDPQVVLSRRPRLAEAAAWAAVEGLPLIKPAVLIEDLQVKEIRHEKVKLENGAQLTGPLVSQHLAGAEQATLMLCTVGEELEAFTAQVIRDDPLRGLALEGLGTAAVENLAAEACKVREAQAAEKGLYPSIPLSPGLVGWAVDPGQREVFSAIDAETVGVRLNESCVMIPRMSLTQVLGFSRTPGQAGRSCDYCAMRETCRYQHHYSVA